MFHMVRFLGQHFELDLIAPALDGAEDMERLCKPYCSEIELVPPHATSKIRRLFRVGPYEQDQTMLAAVQRRLATREYAAIQVEKPAMVPYLPRDRKIPIVLDTWAYGLVGPLRALVHQAELFSRARSLLQLVRFAMFDALCWPETHCILVVSDIDRTRCERARPGHRVMVIPNGVDCEAVRPSPVSSQDQPILLFTGDMGFGPNVDAAILLATRVFPEVRHRFPQAELRLVGRNPSPRVLHLSGPGITVTGQVDDMRPYLHQATLYVAPHFTGAGTRTKLLEAMAAGLAIVTTSIGIEGIEAVPGKEVVIADEPAAMVAATLRILADPGLARQLGTAARRLVENRYEWSTCLEPLERLYSTLLPRKAGACRAFHS